MSLESGTNRCRRRYKRSKTDLEVGVSSSGGSFHFETGCELSEGGMLIQLSELLTVGDVLELCFLIPGEDFVTVKGEIAYQLSPGAHYAGIRFIDPHPSLQASIRRYIENRPTIR